jgi:hypothetical protein
MQSLQSGYQCCANALCKVIFARAYTYYVIGKSIYAIRKELKAEIIPIYISEQGINLLK